MKKILICVGLPASGKTSFAKELIAKDPSFRRVNKDDIRMLLFNETWNTSKENGIQAVENTIVSKLIEQGHNIVIDDTNLNMNLIKRYKEIVLNYSECNNEPCIVEFKYFPVPLEELYERDSKREKKVGKAVINRMAKKNEVLIKKYNLL